MSERNITAHISNGTGTDRVERRSGNSLGLDDEVVRVVPVGQQVSCVIVIHTDVVVTEGPWEEVVNLSGNVEDIAHPVGGGLGRRSL